jgi:hypothetical protein
VNLERVITRLLKSINVRLDQLSINVTSGNIDNMEKYKYIIGQINALEAVKQEISILLNDKEQNNGTVIDISKRDTKA